MFIAVFLVIGGGYYAYRSHADPIGVYWPQQMQQASGSPWQLYSTEGSKSNTLVWALNHQDGVAILPEWRAIIWAKNVRVCANVYNRKGANPVPVEIFPTFDGAVKTKSTINVPGNGQFQKICSYYVQHNDARERIGGTVINRANAGINGDQILLGSMSIEN